MSFRTVETVLEHSRARGSARMVLVVIAECANHEGGDAWPAIDTIAHRAGIARASVFRQIKTLRELGELEVTSKGGRHGCNRYRVTLEPGSQDATVSNRDSRTAATEPSHSEHKTVSPVRPEPSEPPREPSSSPPDPLTAEWADDFAGWLSHHWAVTGMPAPRDGTAALDHIRRMYRARREEGYQATEIAMASEGAFANDYRREQGHFDHESVLRPTKIPKLIDAGRRLRAADSAAGGDWAVWVAEHLPDLEGAAADMAASVAQLAASGLRGEPTPEEVRARIEPRLSPAA